MLRHIEPGGDIIVGAANGEPVGVLDALEASSDALEGVRVHQMIPLRGRPYFDGLRPGLRHVSWSLVAERIPDGATLQAGIGAVPNLVLEMLSDHRELGVHTELFSDGFVGLVEGGVVTGTRQKTHRNKIVTTSAIGTQRLYDFVADNPGVEFHPVEYTIDPRIVSREPLMVAINATIEVDFLGQCASESLGSDYWSSSGGQPDFARGAVMSEHGQAFIVLHSSTAQDTTSRIVPQLPASRGPP